MIPNKTIQHIGNPRCFLSLRADVVHRPNGIQKQRSKNHGYE